MASKKSSRASAGSRAKKSSRPSARPAKSGSPSRKSARPASKKSASAAKPKRPSAAPRPAERPSGPPPVPNAMGLVTLHMDYTTHNFEEVRRFYTQQLGFTRFDLVPGYNYLTIHTTNGSSLGFGPPMPTGEPPMMPREPTLYFMVADVDEAYRKLQTRGVSFEGPPETKPWGHRVLITRDPEGRSIWLAQKMPAPTS